MSESFCHVCGMALMGGRCVFPMCATRTVSVPSTGTLQIVGGGEVRWLRADRIESVTFSGETGRTRIRTYSGDEFQIDGNQVEQLVCKLSWTSATTGGVTKDG